jgi:predicted enzyme related to lactoylglutathione lyase
MMACLLASDRAVAQAQESQVAEQTSAERLLTHGDEAFQDRDYVQAGELYKLAVRAAEEEGHQRVLVEALAQVARSHLKLNEKEEGRSWLERAGKAASPESPLGWSRFLGVRGRFEWKDEQLEEATATFREMYDYCLKHELHSRAVDAAHMVAITAPHEEQIVWGKKGIEAAEEGNLESWLGPLWNNLGWTYEEMGRYEESLEALLKAREYHWKLGSEMNKLIADWSVGHLYRKLERGKQAEAWMRSVLAWSERMYALEPDANAAEWIGHSCRELGELAIAANRQQEALKYLRRAKEKLAEAGMTEWDPEDYQKLSEQIEEVAQKAPEKKPRHTVVHFEIPFDDGQRAVSFYRDLFGWEIVGDPVMDYWMVHTVPVDDQGMPLEQGVNGGMMMRAAPEATTVNYIGVESVDEYLSRAESLGGKIVVGKMPVPQMGWFAHIMDTEGNIFGIFEDDSEAE